MTLLQAITVGRFITSGMLLGVSILLGLRFLNAVHLEPFVQISEPADAPNPLLVYDQFVVTQTLRLEKSGLVKEITIPLLVGNHKAAYPTLIDLRRANGTLLNRWRYRSFNSSEFGHIIETHFELTPARLLDGDIEISFAAPAIHADERDQAVGVLIETAGDRYLNGNYRVAANEKNGDVGLTLVRQVKGFEYVQQEWQQQRADFLTKTGLLLCTLFLVMALPHILVRSVVRTR